MQLTQGAKQLLPPLVRALATSNSAASSVAVATKPSSPGLLSALGFGSSRVNVPLSEPLPNVPQPLRSGTPAAPAKLETSSVEGVKVASIESVSPVTTVALVLSGGSAAETASTVGASKVLEAMAFKATQNRTTFRLTRELEKIGAVAYAQAGRDSISFAIDTVKLHTQEATEILLDSVLNAKLSYHEVRDNLDIVKEVLAKSLANPMCVLDEVLHRVAYDGPLGQPLVDDPHLMAGFTHETLREYYSALLHPSNMLLASIGAEHGQLKALAQPLLSAAHLSSAPSAVPASSYVGGSSNVIATSPLTHVSLGFEAKGGLSDAKGSAYAAVAKALLDESRSALPWIRKQGEVFQSLSSFAHLYKGTGLVGVTASAVPQQAGQCIDAVYKKIEAVANGVSEVQLKVAKQVAIGAHKSALSSSSTSLPVIAASLGATGKFDAADFVSTVDAITPAQITAYVRDLVKGTPTLVTYGGLAHLPRYDAVAKRLA